MGVGSITKVISMRLECIIIKPNYFELSAFGTTRKSNSFSQKNSFNVKNSNINGKKTYFNEAQKRNHPILQINSYKIVAKKPLLDINTFVN